MTSALDSEPSQRKYVLENMLGKGAYGAVWKASFVCDSDGTTKSVAIKRVHPEAMKNAGAAFRILREIQLMAHFRNHPNIMGLEDMIPLPNPSFSTVNIVMELMETDLEKVLRPPGKERPTLEERDVKWYLYQILCGMYHLHSAGVAHRDLKPSNILLNLESKVLKITDFGLARAMKSNEELSLGVVTQYYRPPELLMDDSHYTSVVDMWGVGCIFAELLSPDHVVLFRGTNAFQQLGVILRVIGSPSEEDLASVGTELARTYVNLNLGVLPPTNLRDRLGSSLADDALDLLLKMLQFNPTKRISALDAMRHDCLKRGYLQEDEVAGKPFTLDQSNVSSQLPVVKTLIFQAVSVLVKEFKTEKSLTAASTIVEPAASN